MKRVNVNVYEVALLFKRGAYQRMLKEGIYWLWPWENVMVYYVTKPFVAPIELNILLKDEVFADEVQVIEVKDNEIVLVYANDIMSSVLKTGRYTYWRSVVKYDFIRADISKIEITENISRATLSNNWVLPYVRTYSVESYELAVLFVDGKYVQQLQSGVYFWWKNSIPINVGKVDTHCKVDGRQLNVV
jgi:hypothetical protein